MLAELGVAVGDVAARLRRDGIVHVGVLGLFEKAHGARELTRAEQAAEPVIEAGHEQAFAQVDGAGMADFVLGCVVAEEHAPVVGGVVVPAALHPPVADPAVQQPAQQVRARGAPRRALRVGAPCPAQRLGPLEDDGVDERFVRGLLGPDPVADLVPALLGGEPERDIVHVEQHLVLALPVPHLAAGVAGVAQDRGDCAPGPGDPAAMWVAGWVVGRRGRDAVPGECFGYGLDAHAREVVGEDPADHVGGLRIRRERMQALAVRGLGRVRVRPGVDEHVPVGRTPAEVAAF